MNTARLRLHLKDMRYLWELYQEEDKSDNIPRTPNTRSTSSEPGAISNGIRHITIVFLTHTLSGPYVHHILASSGPNARENRVQVKAKR